MIQYDFLQLLRPAHFSFFGSLRSPYALFILVSTSPTGTSTAANRLHKGDPPKAFDLPQASLHLIGRRIQVEFACHGISGENLGRAPVNLRLPIAATRVDDEGSDLQNFFSRNVSGMLQYRDIRGVRAVVVPARKKDSRVCYVKSNRSHVMGLGFVVGVDDTRRQEGVLDGQPG